MSLGFQLLSMIITELQPNAGERLTIIFVAFEGSEPPGCWAGSWLGRSGAVAGQKRERVQDPISGSAVAGSTCLAPSAKGLPNRQKFSSYEGPVARCPSGSSACRS